MSEPDLAHSLAGAMMDEAITATKALAVNLRGDGTYPPDQMLSLVVRADPVDDAGETHGFARVYPIDGIKAMEFAIDMLHRAQATGVGGDLPEPCALCGLRFAEQLEFGAVVRVLLGVLDELEVPPAVDGRLKAARTEVERLLDDQAG